MKRIFIFSFLLLIFGVSNARDIFACDCIIGTSENLQEFQKLVEYAYENSEAVFSGKVIEISKKPHSSIVSVKFKVDKSWKSVSQKESVQLITGEGDEDCGYKFEVGKKYLVYTHKQV